MKLNTVMKSTLIGMIAGTALLLSGCSTLPKPTKKVVKCKVNNMGEWECDVEVTWQKSSGNYNNLAQVMNGDFALDFSNSSNLMLENQFDIGSITLKSNGLPIATKSSTYQKSGQSIVADNNANLVNWLASHDGQADEITITINQLKFEAVLGTNTTVMELTYNGDVFAGTSTSEYISPFSPVAQQINTY